MNLYKHIKVQKAIEGKETKQKPRHRGKKITEKIILHKGLIQVLSRYPNEKGLDVDSSSYIIKNLCYSLQPFQNIVVKKQTVNYNRKSKKTEVDKFL